MHDLDDDDNFSMRFQSLEEVVGQVCLLAATSRQHAATNVPSVLVVGVALLVVHSLQPCMHLP